MATKTAGVEVFTPRPRNGRLPLHEQLLTSCSSTDSTTENSILAPQNGGKNHERGRVKFATPTRSRKSSSTERIKVDEVDDDTTTARMEEKPMCLTNSRSRSRSRSRSSLRNATGPRSASRPARRRALSRGRPISRETTDDEGHVTAMTPDEIARELRPESFTRYKKITLASDKKSIFSKVGADGDSEILDSETHARTTGEQIEQGHSPSNTGFIEALSPTTPRSNSKCEWE